ncbi:MAG TPA: hypothetical protein VK829_17330 [Terriglobales bacterium]|nr:hypothetical protein [Terriglobales bacterium]
MLRLRALLLFSVIFFSYAYFYEGAGWNQNSRLDMVRAMVEQGTLRIDAFHQNTEDKAFANGHYYSDKAPGLALLAVPIAEATRPILRALNIDPESPRGLLDLAYCLTVFAVALPMAAACVCLFWIAVALGASVNASAFAAVALGLSTPMWAYSTLFWGHALAAACLVFAFACALKLRGHASLASDVLWGAALGLSTGWATVTEYPSAPASALIAGLALALVWRDGMQRRGRVLLGIGAGALPCVIALMCYQHAAFGSILHPSYAYYPPGAFSWMKHGYMGLTYPRIDVALKLLFGCRRGLLFSGPVVLAAPFGLRRLGKQPSSHAPAVAATLIAAYYFLFHASFFSWPAGWSYGPRYMAPGLPFLCLGLAPLWDHADRVWRIVLGMLAAAGVGLTLMAVSVSAQPPDEFHCPLPQFYWPSFWAGRFSLNLGSALIPAEQGTNQVHGSFNVGELLGLHGLATLIPLLAVWALAAVLWMWIIRLNSRDSSPGEGAGLRNDFHSRRQGLDRSTLGGATLQRCGNWII